MIPYYCLNRKFFWWKLEDKDGWLQNRKGNVALNGLDGYCLPKLIDRFEYAERHPTKSFFK
jgi:hypothetical protein